MSINRALTSSHSIIRYRTYSGFYSNTNI